MRREILERESEGEKGKVGQLGRFKLREGKESFTARITMVIYTSWIRQPPRFLSQISQILLIWETYGRFLQGLEMWERSLSLRKLINGGKDLLL